MSGPDELHKRVRAALIDLHAFDPLTIGVETAEGILRSRAESVSDKKTLDVSAVTRALPPNSTPFEVGVAMGAAYVLAVARGVKLEIA